MARGDLSPSNDTNAKDWRSVMSRNQLVDREELRVCAGPRPVVHLELHTPDLPAARDFYLSLLNWRPERLDTEHGHYTALDLGGKIGGGVVQCGTDRPLWIPYVQVDRIDVATDHARTLGGSVLLEPREGPAGWRSVVAAPACAELALWQPKEWT
jgi:predicted enzyme related to lactoylglutathione lyase